MLKAYVEPIMSAIWLFPFVALFFTLPYFAVQYHRRGAIPMLRILIVYSFILYLMCAYFLTMLPLPDREVVTKLTTPYLQLTPFADVAAWVRESGAVLSSPSTWRRLINRDLFVMLANIVMTIPFGIYLRYYFHCSLKKTVLLSLGLSLVFELTQLSALFGIYPRPYRLCETDDLITNTLGGLLGYLLAGPLTKHLPTTQRLDEVAYKRSSHVSVTRRIAAALIDWILLGFLMLCAIVFIPPLRHVYTNEGDIVAILLVPCLLYVAAVILCFMLGEWLRRGYTVGKKIVHIRMVDARDDSRPKLWQCVVRYSLLYFLFMPLPLVSLLLLMTASDDSAASGMFLVLFIAALALYGIMMIWGICRVVTRSGSLPHGQLSKTRNVSTLRIPQTAAELPQSTAAELPAANGAAGALLQGQAAVEALPKAGAAVQEDSRG